LFCFTIIFIEIGVLFKRKKTHRKRGTEESPTRVWVLCHSKGMYKRVHKETNMRPTKKTKITMYVHPTSLSTEGSVENQKETKEEPSQPSDVDSRVLDLKLLERSIRNANYGKNLSEIFSQQFIDETNRKAKEETLVDFPNVPVQIVSLPADRGRCTIVGSAQVISKKEFEVRLEKLNERVCLIRPQNTPDPTLTKKVTLNETPLMAALKWARKDTYESGELKLVNLSVLLASFLSTDKTTIHDIREKLAEYKQERRGKALETPPSGLNMFYAQLWGVFCGIFGAGKYDLTNKFREAKTKPSGIQHCLFVDDGTTLEFAILGITDRYSSSQLKSASELKDWVSNLCQALGEPSEEAREKWVEKNIVGKPTLIYNGNVADEFKPLIRERIAGKLVDFPNADVNEFIGLLKKQDWQKCAVDTVLSEKYERGTEWGATKSH